MGLESKASTPTCRSNSTGEGPTDAADASSHSLLRSAVLKLRTRSCQHGGELSLAL